MGGTSFNNQQAKKSNRILSVDSERIINDVADEAENLNLNISTEVSDKELLLPPRKGGMSRTDDKTLRKVQWNDRNGHNLVEVLEFDPSDRSDSDDEDLDSCICTIM
uniref:Uncharacterized protein n=1 Tax=Kalanchoe fedtschenkoi TaxID=63787 RepID=A0A7N0U4K8_KALFE